MVSYPDLSSLSNNSGIEGLMSLPNSSYPFFWPAILAGIWIIISLTMYFKEKSMRGVGNLLSSMAVSALACIMLATVGSLFGLFTVVTLVPVIVFCVVIIVIWIIASSR